MKWTLRAASHAICLALLMSTATRVARAAELRIDWRAPAVCPSASNVKAHALTLLDGAVHSGLIAEVEVTQREDTFHAQIVLRGPNGFGERQIEDQRCDVLADSVAVLIALSVPPPARLDTGAGLALVLRPEARVLSGALPRLAAGIGAAIAVEGLASLRLELHGTYYGPQSSNFAGTALGGRFQLLTLGASLCRTWSIGRLHAGPCLGAQLHYISASGFGGDIELPGNTSFWGPSLRLFGGVQLWSFLSIHMSVEGVVPVTRPQFVFSDLGPLHRVSAVALQVSAGPEVRF
jgi:hypothetical protein